MVSEYRYSSFYSRVGKFPVIACATPCRTLCICQRDIQNFQQIFQVDRRLVRLFLQVLTNFFALTLFIFLSPTLLPLFLDHTFSGRNLAAILCFGGPLQSTSTCIDAHSD
jgi:hypothetical protein